MLRRSEDAKGTTPCYARMGNAISALINSPFGYSVAINSPSPALAMTVRDSSATQTKVADHDVAIS
jgi:hypothetical protein